MLLILEPNAGRLSGPLAFWVIGLYVAAALATCAIILWTVARGELRPADWGLSLKQSWPLLSMLSIAALVGLFVNQIPPSDWGCDLPTQSVVFSVDIVLKAGLLTLLSRRATGRIGKYSIELVLVYNVLLLYPSLGFSDSINWFLMNVLGIVALRWAGTVVLATLATMNFYISDFCAKNGAVIVLNVLALYLLAALVVETAQAIRFGKARASEP